MKKLILQKILQYIAKHVILGLQESLNNNDFNYQLLSFGLSIDNYAKKYDIYLE